MKKKLTKEKTEKAFTAKKNSRKHKKPKKPQKTLRKGIDKRRGRWYNTKACESGRTSSKAEARLSEEIA